MLIPRDSQSLGDIP